MNPPYEDVQRRVLVVEDNRDCAESLRQLLVRCGYEVLVTHDGEQGLVGARRLQPHVVLCDIGLPDTDGYTVGTVLRQSGRAPRARLIALTGYGEPEDRRRALAAGFDQHLVKPVETNVLLRELETGIRP
jgi:CheY-like chemotaxis protein